MDASLNLIDFAALGPLLILLVGALVILLVESFAEHVAKKFSATISFTFITLALFATIYAPASTNPLLTPWLQFDQVSQFFTLFFLAIGLAATLLSSSFFQRFESSHGEYFFLLLAALFGLILIGYSADFLTLFLGIETLAISLYVLCGYMKTWELSHEASIKYFLTGALATAFLLYGIALVYGATGTTRLDELASSYQNIQAGTNKTLFLSGIALITLGLCFEAAVAPFQTWAPDVYCGAPTPVTAFMAVGTKVGALAAFVRVFLVSLPQFDPLWNQGIAFLAYPTLIYANIVAIRQIQLRRFFAYSGIAHAGYMIMPLAAGGPEAMPALMFYLVVYVIATLGSFAVIAYLDTKAQGVMLQDLQGLFKRSPWLATTLTLCLLTLAGIPPTAGFFAKFYVLKVTFQAGFYGLVIVGLVTAVLSAYYYLRIIAVMFSEKQEHEVEAPKSYAAALVGGAAFACLVVLACYPTPLMVFLSITK